MKETENGGKLTGLQLSLNKGSFCKRKGQSRMKRKLWGRKLSFASSDASFDSEPEHMQCKPQCTDAIIE